MPIAYLTDVEGQWPKLESFAAPDNPYVQLDVEGRLVVSESEDAIFVFGGDAIDRGPAGRRVVRTLLEAKRRQPDRVVLLAGNRDLNKLRLARELAGFPHPRSPAEVRGERGALLRWTFARTMGAAAAFEHRRAELVTEGAPGGDDDVAQSYLEDLAEGGSLRAYLSACALAFRAGETLFVHGGVTAESLGVVPGIAGRVGGGVDGWIAALNAFYDRQMRAFCEGRLADDGTPEWAELVAYQAPVPGTGRQQASVVYARPTVDAEEMLALPDFEVIEALGHDGIGRVVVGHTPCGDCPAILRDDGGFEMVLADNSYGRVESGARVVVDGERVVVDGETELDGGGRRRVHFEARRGDGVNSPLGRRDRRTGQLVKAQLAGGEYLLFRPLGERRVEQLAVSAAELVGRDLVAPR